MKSDWPEVALTDIYEISSGLSKPADSFGSGYPFLSFKEVFGNYFIPDELVQLVESTEKEREKGSIKRGDVFLTRTSETMHELGMSSVAIKDYPDATFNGFSKRLRLKDGAPYEVHPEFMGYCLRSPKFRRGMLAFSTMSTRASLNNDMISRLTVELPPINIQKNIAQVLKTLDDKIKLNRQTNQTLEQIAQAIFKSWFVDFEPTRAKIAAKQTGQDPERAAMAAISGKTLDELDQLNAEQQEQLKTTAALFPDALVDSELGEIPDGWGTRKIGEVVERLKPKKRYTKKQVETFGLIPVYEQGADILLGYHNEEAGFEACPETPLFIFGDHTCVIHLSCEDFDISQNVIPLAGNGFPTIWVYYAVQGKQDFQEYRRHWSEFIVKDVISPSVEIADEYARFTTKLYQQKEQFVRESKTLEQVRDSVLPKLLSGELKIGEVA